MTVTFGYNRKAAFFDTSLMDSMDDTRAPTRTHTPALAVADSSLLRPVVAEAETTDVCVSCRQPVVAFTGSFDDGKGFRLDGASMERCGCGARLTPRRYIQPDKTVVTDGCLASITRIQEAARTVKCGSRKCSVTFDLVGGAYQKYCSPDCRQSETKQRKMELAKERRRERREQAKVERGERRRLAEVTKSLAVRMTFAAAVA